MLHHGQINTAYAARVLHDVCYAAGMRLCKNAMGCVCVCGTAPLLDVAAEVKERLGGWLEERVGLPVIVQG